MQRAFHDVLPQPSRFRHAIIVQKKTNTTLLCRALLNARLAILISLRKLLPTVFVMMYVHGEVTMYVELSAFKQQQPAVACGRGGRPRHNPRAARCLRSWGVESRRP